MCRNGIDYDECDNQGQVIYRGYCEDCWVCEAEKAQEAKIEEFYGGSQPVTLREKQEQARKL